MSINVETVGDVLMVQHYVAEVHERAYCRTVSISDSITAASRTKVQVVWGLSAKKLDDILVSTTTGRRLPTSPRASRASSAMPWRPGNC